jgi:hypothetical protein
VGVEKAAAFIWRSKHYEIGLKMCKSYTKHTVEGYMSTMNSELVPVGNMLCGIGARLAAGTHHRPMRLGSRVHRAALQVTLGRD